MFFFYFVLALFLLEWRSLLRRMPQPTEASTASWEGSKHTNTRVGSVRTPAPQWLEGGLEVAGGSEAARSGRRSQECPALSPPLL